MPTSALGLLRQGVAARVLITLGFGLGLVLGGCDALEAPILKQAGVEPDSDFGATVPNVAAGESMTFGFIALCVDSNTGVTVTAASFEESTNLEVVDFAVDKAPHANDAFGAEKVSLGQAGFDVTQREVSASYPNDGDFLGLELRRGAEPVSRNVSDRRPSPSTSSCAHPPTSSTCAGAMSWSVSSSCREQPRKMPASSGKATPWRRCVETHAAVKPPHGPHKPKPPLPDTASARFAAL